VPQTAVAAIEWTHFGDLVNIFGVGDDGFARSPWDNVGVQYGLEAVANGSITPEEFLKLNANIGGWKNEPEMLQEWSPFFPPGVIDLSNWDPWSVRNQVLSPDGGLTPAQRTEGDMPAAQAADEPMGACAELFPPYSTSRIVAGGPFKGSIFKCALQPVSEAIADGLYGVWQPTAVEQARLEQIFPDGVCDFSKQDMGLPPGW
jgi:hypothetical protein